MTNNTRGLDRGSIMLVVVTTVGVLMALTVTLFSIVLSSHNEKNAQEGLDSALNVSEMAIEKMVAQIAASVVTRDASGDMRGFEGGSIVVPSEGLIDGTPYAAELRSAYFTRLNSAAPTFMTEVEEQRGDPTEPIFDVYQVKAAAAAVVGPELTMKRGAAVVYAIKKSLVVPSALYIKDSKPEILTDNFQISGMDHKLQAPDVSDLPGLRITGTLDLPKEFDMPEAGLHSSLHYINPETGEEMLVFEDGHAASANFDGLSIGEDPDDPEAQPTIFKRGSLLDLYIRTYADSWGLGTYDHHIFGHYYSDPGHRNDGKSFGTVFSEEYTLLADTNVADLRAAFAAAHPEVIAEYPNFSFDPGSDRKFATEEDYTGDGVTNVERDMDGNGEISVWFRGSRNEDENDNGVWDNDDYVLGNKIRNFLADTHENADEHTYGDGDGRYPIIEKYNITVGWEDLPGHLDWNDWDYDDLKLRLELTPAGVGDSAGVDVLYPDGYVIKGVRGIPAIGYLGEVGDLGLDVYTRYQQVDSNLLDSHNEVVERQGALACERLIAPFDSMEFAAAYVGGSRAGLEPRGNINLNLDGQWGSLETFETFYIDNAGSTTLELDGHQFGYGVLVVTGDLVLRGQIAWFGAIVVLGDLTIDSDGAGVHVLGSVMCEGEFKMEGNNGCIWYSREALRKCFRDLNPDVTVYAEKQLWRELSPVEIADLGL